MLSSFFDFISDTAGSIYDTATDFFLPSFNPSPADSDESFSTGLSNQDITQLGGLAALLTSPAGLGLGGNFFGRPAQPVGYQGGIPDYTVVRNPVQNMYDAEQRRPGSRGRRYFTKTRFVPTEDSDLLSQERLFAAEEAEGIRRAQNTIESPTGGVASVAPTVMTPGPTSLPASGVASVLPVPTYTMASEFPAPVEEVKAMATGGITSAQEQARKDAEALGMSLDDYYDLGFFKRLELAKQDIGEVFNPSLGPLLQNPNNVDTENARILGILSHPKPSTPIPESPMMPPGGLPADPRPPRFQGRPSLPPTKPPRFQGTPPPTPKGPRDFPFFGLDPSLIPPSSDTTIPPATYQGRGVPPKPKLNIKDFKGSLNKNDAFRKRQKERREWDKKYGDMYNDDGTLKIDSGSFLEQLLQILGPGLGGGLADIGTRGLAKGGMLDGATDGMADKVPAMIDNADPAALSDGEYVLTADVVSHLGNGNSDAGAKVLDNFMGDVRMARTGTKKQAPEINPQKFLPKV